MYKGGVDCQYIKKDPGIPFEARCIDCEDSVLLLGSIKPSILQSIYHDAYSHPIGYYTETGWSSTTLP